MAKIVAKVATVISESEVAFNVGSESGVKINYSATIQRPVRIEDPDTHEELGTVLVPALKLKVSLVADKYSVGVVDELQDNPDDLSTIVFTRPRRKRIVEPPSVAKTGVSVVIGIGDRVQIESVSVKDDATAEVDTGQ